MSPVAGAGWLLEVIGVVLRLRLRTRELDAEEYGEGDNYHPSQPCGASTRRSLESKGGRHYRAPMLLI
jgi:hypothetical protein